MIATLRSFGSLPNFSLATWATKSVDIRPNWRPLGCGRNTYLRCRFSSTAEGMQVVIHMNFFSCSMPAASGAVPKANPAAHSPTARRAKNPNRIASSRENCSLSLTQFQDIPKQRARSRGAIVAQPVGLLGSHVMAHDVEIRPEIRERVL